MDIINLNIGGAAIKRSVEILDWLSKLNAEVIILTELRNNKGSRYIENGLKELGYFVKIDYSDDYSVLIASLLEVDYEISFDNNFSTRFNVLVLKKSRVNLVAIYVPSNDRKKITRKKEIMNYCLDRLGEFSHCDYTIICGDFNTVKRDHFPKYSMFRKWEYDFFDEIYNMGYMDTFDYIEPKSLKYSWFGRTGNPYKYDYCFVSEGIIDKVYESFYTDETIKLGLSDHCAQIIRIRDIFY